MSKSTSELELLLTLQSDKFDKEMSALNVKMDKLGASGKKATEGIGAGFKSALPDMSKYAVAAGAAGLALSAVSKGISDMIAKETALADFSALTGVSGVELKKFGDIADEMARKFGTSVVDNITTFKGILGRLGPDIAKNSDALEKMAVNVNTLAVATGMDATASMDALTTAMLQFGVDTSDPAKAADEMAVMMNVMAAAAKEGAAEVPDLSEALKQVGVTAKGLNISFTETNAALEVLATGGRVGSEAGVSLRNVLTGLIAPSKIAQKWLSEVGVDTKQIGNILTTQGVQAALEYFNDGMNKLGTDAEKAALAEKVFGKENMAAAQILLRSAKDVGVFNKAIEGTQTAFEQASINMNTTQKQLDRMGEWASTTGVSVLEFFKQGAIGAANLLSGGALNAQQSSEYNRAMTEVWDDMSLLEQAQAKLLGMSDERMAEVEQRAAKYTEIAGKTKKAFKAAGVGADLFDMKPGEMMKPINDAFSVVSAQAAQSAADINAAVAGSRKQLEYLLGADVKSMTRSELGALSKEVKDFAANFRPGSREDKALQAVSDRIDAILKPKQGGKGGASKGKVGAEDLGWMKGYIPTSTEFRKTIDQLVSDYDTDFIARMGGIQMPDITERWATEQADAMTEFIVSMERDFKKVENLARAIEGVVSETFGGIGDAIGKALTGGEVDFKDTLKSILNTLLDFVEVEWVAAQAAATIRAFLTFGVSALADSWGWVASLAALELTRGLVNSFAAGTMKVPYDQTANIHKGEIIVPAPMSESIRRGEASLTGGGSGVVYRRATPQRMDIRTSVMFDEFARSSARAMSYNSRKVN